MTILVCNAAGEAWQGYRSPATCPKCRVLSFGMALSLLWVDALQFPLRTYSVFMHNQHGAMKEPLALLSRGVSRSSVTLES